MKLLTNEEQTSSVRISSDRTSIATAASQTGDFKVDDTEDNNVFRMSDNLSDDFEPGLVECLFPMLYDKNRYHGG